MLYPLLPPQEQFTDRFGNPSAWSEMNPSLYYNTDTKEYTVLVRLIDYKKFRDRSFVLHHSNSNSKYLIARSKSLTNLEFHPLTISYNLPTFGTYWKGVEDIRFIDSETVLCCVPELHSSGNPTLFTATLKENTLSNFKLCSPSPNEKNWMPFTDLSGRRMVIYSLTPFVIKPLYTDEKEMIGIFDELQGFHGSTNGIPITDKNTEWIFLIHKTEKNRVMHKWVSYNLETKKVKFTDSFYFFKHSYIEFPCSLVDNGDKWLVSLGVNDDRAFIIDVDPAFVSETLNKLK